MEPLTPDAVADLWDSVPADCELMTVQALCAALPADEARAILLAAQEG